MPCAAGLTVLQMHEQDTTGEQETGTKKSKSRLHGYVKILQAPGGVNVQVLFDSIQEDISYILRVQMKNHKRLFMRWSPKPNRDASLVGFQLEPAEAALVRDSCEPVFSMIKKALHDGTLPATHLCHALTASIVQCTRVDVGTDSGAAPGDILWHAMCATCLQDLQAHVNSRGLEKVDISPKPHSMYARMLQIKQFGDCEAYVYQEENPRHNVWPWKPGLCAACYATSGVIPKYKHEGGGAQKAHGGAARKSRAQALRRPPRSFERMFNEQCSDYFDSESETTQTPGGRGAACGGAGVVGSVDEEDDSDYECEDLSSDDDLEVRAWEGYGRGFDGYPGDHDSDGAVEQGQGRLPTPQGDDHNARAWQGHRRDFDGYPGDGEVQEGQEHALMLQDNDLDGHCSVNEFFAMDKDMERDFQEFLLNVHAASPPSQTGGAGAAVCTGAGAAAGIGMHMEPHAANETPSLMDYVCSPGSMLPSASASATTGTGAKPQAAVLPTASPSASASASTNTGTGMEAQAALPTPGRKRSAMDYVLNPGWVQSSARAGVAFALRMLQQSAQGNTHEARAQ